MTRRSAPHGLRQGFTTGSAAAAAAKAALSFLLTGEVPAVADIPLPPGGRLAVPVESVVAVREEDTSRGVSTRSPDAREGAGCAPCRSARATVVKDAGDDPDATHGAHISTLATLWPGGGPDAYLPEGSARSSPGQGRVDIEGGSGVGRVTLPGLPVPVGMAAINPVPLAQIERAAREALEASGESGRVRLVIEVENGLALARNTLNPRLGVVGGISILGTQGIVKPFSLEAWKATIDSGLEVARASGTATAALSTGRRGERLLMARRPDLPELAFVQAADFFAYATQRAVGLGFTEIVWGCFFGKLVKMAQGLPSTHAHAAPTDFAALAELAGLAGADGGVRQEVARANTARHALEIVPGGLVRERFAALTAAKALEAAQRFAGEAPGPGAVPGIRMGVCCFGFEGGVLAEAYFS